MQITLCIDVISTPFYMTFERHFYLSLSERKSYLMIFLTFFFFCWTKIWLTLKNRNTNSFQNLAKYRRVPKPVIKNMKIKAPDFFVSKSHIDNYLMFFFYKKNERKFITLLPYRQDTWERPWSWSTKNLWWKIVNKTLTSK